MIQQMQLYYVIIYAIDSHRYDLILMHLFAGSLIFLVFFKFLSYFLFQTAQSLLFLVMEIRDDGQEVFSKFIGDISIIIGKLSFSTFNPKSSKPNLHN